MPSKKSRGTALITGAAQRIGKAIALSLADKGYNIALHCHSSQKEALKLLSQIRNKGVKCEVFICDLSDEKATAALIAQVVKEFPKLNVLVNNASVFYPSGLSTADLKSLNHHMAVNFRAPFILTCEFARLCRKGVVVNLLDTNVVRYKSAHAGYLLSKKMLTEFTKMAAIEMGPHVRVNGVSPGLVLAPVGKGLDYLEARAEKIPLRNPGRVEHVTRSIEFLIDNDFLTGEIIFADGGEQLI